MLNITKFVLNLASDHTATIDDVTHPVDRAMLTRLDHNVTEATRAFGDFDYARALERTESLFWWFCDDYVELVKSRAYDTDDPARNSALSALRIAVDTMQRLLAPLLPFATEEAWRWSHDSSVHAADWPTPLGIGADDVLDPVLEVLAQVRRAKTEAKVSQRAVAERVNVAAADATDAVRAALSAGQGDLCNAGSITELVLIAGDDLSCQVTLAPVAS
jgi:valyl-tRNA synthetase